MSRRLAPLSARRSGCRRRSAARAPGGRGRGAGEPTRTSQQLKRDVLVHSDMWARKPKMMAAGLGFTQIIGVPGMNADDLAWSEQAVRDAGGAWDRLECADTATLGDYTSAASPSGVTKAGAAPASDERKSDRALR